MAEKTAAAPPSEHHAAYEYVIAMLSSALEQDTWLLVGVAT